MPNYNVTPQQDYRTKKNSRMQNGGHGNPQVTNATNQGRPNFAFGNSVQSQASKYQDMMNKGYTSAFNNAMSSPVIGQTSNLYQQNPEAFNMYLENNPQAMQGFGNMDFSKQAPGAFGSDTVIPESSGIGNYTPTMEQLGAGVGIAKDIYGMYTANEGMKLAKDQLNMQKSAFQDNKNNRNRIVNGAKLAFA